MVIYVANCERCGLPLPDGAEYCPNCGVPVRKRREIPIPIATPTVKLLEAGLLGAFFSIMLGSFVSGVDLYFIPSFIGALIAVLLFRTRRLDEAVTIALASYLFANAIINVINIGSLYFSNMSWLQLAEDYPELYNELNQVPTIIDVLMYIADPISAIVAAYLGYKLIPKPKTVQPTPYSYGKRDDQGGIVYFANNEEKKPSTNFPHKV
jgi:hypothetical protein